MEDCACIGELVHGAELDQEVPIVATVTTAFAPRTTFQANESLNFLALTTPSIRTLLFAEILLKRQRSSEYK